MIGTGTLEHLLGEYGYGLVLVVIMLEAMGVPAPGESLIVAAGIYAATTQQLRIQWIVAAAIAGAILGDNIGYLIGRRLGIPLLQRYGRRIGLTEQRLDLARWLFRTQGGKVVFFGRFIALLRTFVSLFAGAVGMDWTVFMLWNAVGGVVWASVYGGGAYLFGETMRRVEGPIAIVMGVAAGLAVLVGFFVVRHGEHRLERRAREATKKPD